MTLTIQKIYLELRAKHPKASRSQMAKLMAERSMEDDEMRTAVAEYIVTAFENEEMH
jgi:hypothetical protein